jgi:outer membrane protein OmpA-like peptidoglycan-associated protein
MTKSLHSNHFGLILIIIMCNKSFSNVPNSESIAEHLNFITKTKNSNDAFVSFQRIIAKDVKNKNYSQVNEKIQIYKKVFTEKFENFDSTKFEKLYEIINTEDDQEVFRKKWLSRNVNTSKNETNPIIFKTKEGYQLYFISKDRKGGVGEEDIFFSTTRNIFNWKKPYNFYYNTKKPEAVTYASPTSVLFYSHRKSKKGGIYLTTYEGDAWSNPLILPSPVNDEYSFDSDAIFIKNENTIIFVSDRSSQYFDYRQKGDYFHGDYWGNTDIYISFKDGSSWAKPVNLGSTINTPFGERTPWLSEDGMTLYFSSDGHTGLGKMDVFKSTRLSESSWTEWSEPENLGRYINTPNNDYGYKLIEDSTTYAVFSSKKTHNSNYDIALVQLTESLAPPISNYTLKGEILDKDGNPVPDVPVIAENNKSGKKLAKGNTDENGKYQFKLPKMPNLDDLSIYPDDPRFVPKTVPLSSLIPPSSSKEGESKKEKINKSDKVNKKPKNLNTKDEDNLSSLKESKSDRKNNQASSSGSSLSIAKEKLQNFNNEKNDIKKQSKSEDTNNNGSSGSLPPLYAKESKINSYDSNSDLFSSKRTTIPLEKSTPKYYNKPNSIVDMLKTAPIVKALPIQVLNIEESDCNQTQIGLSTVNFESKEWVLSKGTKNELDRLADFLMYEDVFTLISGHTDSDSSESYNKTLSSNRANEVRSYLIKRGIEESKVLAKGQGESMPISDESTPDKKKLNRRVEFCITSNNSESIDSK